MTDPLLIANRLTLQYLDAREPAVRDLSFSMAPGEILSLRGPSGAGKSTIVWALMGVPDLYRIRGTGTVTFLEKTTDLTDPPASLRRDWRDMALVPQSSMTALNPVLTIGKTMTEMMQCHEPGKSKGSCLPRIRELLEAVRQPGHCHSPFSGLLRLASPVPSGCKSLPRLYDSHRPGFFKNRPCLSPHI